MKNDTAITLIDLWIIPQKINPAYSTLANLHNFAVLPDNYIDTCLNRCEQLTSVVIKIELFTLLCALLLVSYRLDE